MAQRQSAVALCHAGQTPPLRRSLSQSAALAHRRPVYASRCAPAENSPQAAALARRRPVYASRCAPAENSPQAAALARRRSVYAPKCANCGPGTSTTRVRFEMRLWGKVSTSCGPGTSTTHVRSEMRCWGMFSKICDALLGDTFECLDILLARDLGHFDIPLGSRLLEPVLIPPLQHFHQLPLLKGPAPPSCRWIRPHRAVVSQRELDDGEGQGLLQATQRHAARDATEHRGNTRFHLNSNQKDPSCELFHPISLVLRSNTTAQARTIVGHAQPSQLRPDTGGRLETNAVAEPCRVVKFCPTRLPAIAPMHSARKLSRHRGDPWPTC